MFFDTDYSNVVIWFSGNVVEQTKEVNRHWSGLVLRWVLAWIMDVLYRLPNVTKQIGHSGQLGLAIPTGWV